MAARHRVSSLPPALAATLALACVVACSPAIAQGQTTDHGPALAEVEVAPGSGQSFRDRQADGQPCPMCPELVIVPAGRFTMGSPAAEAERLANEEEVGVSISQPFAVGKFAVTFDEWDACVADNGCDQYRPVDPGWGRGNRPAISISWHDAKAYVAWLNAKTGKAYRLLSETEREYVTRAGTVTPFWWGTSVSTDQANYNGNFSYLGGGTKGPYRFRTLPVDSLPANPWGLHHVHGNVWEWTEDCWIDSNVGNPGNGSARLTGDCTRRVVRGGSFYNIPSWIRSARRHWFSAVMRNPVLGFRVARALGS